MININSEYQAAHKRLELERNIIRELLVDEVQFNRNISRNEAEARIDLEIFERMRGTA